MYIIALPDCLLILTHSIIKRLHEIHLSNERMFISSWSCYYKTPRCPAHPLMTSQIDHIFESHQCDNTVMSVFSEWGPWGKAALRQNTLDTMDCNAETLHHQLGLYVTACSQNPISDYSALLHRKTKHPSMRLYSLSPSYEPNYSFLYLHRCFVTKGHTHIFAHMA